MARSIVNLQRRVREVQSKPSAATHGFLAEDYDGIGQYVLVSMSRTSTSAAYKARVAAGDFGTGQVIPSGSPVTLFVHRGQIEILSLGGK